MAPKHTKSTANVAIAEEESREKETAGEEKEPQRKFMVKGSAEDFVHLNKLLKKFEIMDPNTKRFSLIEECSGCITC